MKFSIVIPVYNVAPWLRACLDSVRAQTFADFECICVDDGSTDGSSEILDEFQKEVEGKGGGGQWKVIHQPNGGEGAARNAGLDIAKGEWICFLDADDVLNERTLEAYACAIRAHADAELVAVNMVRFEDAMVPTWSDEAAQWRSFDCRKTVPATVYFLNPVMCAFQADLLRGLQFGGLKIGADRVFISQVVERVETAVVTDWIGYGYRQRSGSALHSRDAAAPLLDDLCHYEALMRTVQQSSKSYETAIVRQLGVFLTDNFAAVYYRLPSAERNQVWEKWLAVMDILSGMEGLRPYMRLVMRLVVRTRSKALARLLIWGILWLKLHGVNRRLVVTK